MAQGTPYKPVTPGQLYLDGKTFANTLDAFDAMRISPFNEHEGEARRGHQSSMLDRASGGRRSNAEGVAMPNA